MFLDTPGTDSHPPQSVFLLSAREKAFNSPLSPGLTHSKHIVSKGT